MTRSAKTGIDYFSHDVTMSNDKKIKILIAQKKLIGYAVYNRLLEEIYRDEGYFLTTDNDFNILFSHDCGLELNDYIDILNVCIKAGLFDKRLYENFDILTSKRIQENYFAGTQRRDEVCLLKPYLLLDPLKHYNQERKNRVNVIILDLNDDIKDENADTGTQSKVKESKVKESKGKGGSKNPHSPLSDFDDFLDNIPDYLSEKYSFEQIKDKTEDLVDYCRSKGKRYKDYYATLSNWLKKDSRNNKDKPLSVYEHNERFLRHEMEKIEHEHGSDN